MFDIYPKDEESAEKKWKNLDVLICKAWKKLTAVKFDPVFDGISVKRGQIDEKNSI